MEASKVFKKDKIILRFALANCKEESTYRMEFRIIDSEDTKGTFITEEKRNKYKNGSIQFSKTFPFEYDFSKIELFKLNLKRWGQSKFINLLIKEKYHLSLSSIVSSKNSVFKTKSRENTDDCETIIISADNPNYSPEEKNLKNFIFFDYLKAGIQFNSFIIIDFNEKSLHTYDINANQFLQSIQGIRETLFEFVKSFKVYGYGASLKNGLEGKKFFNLSMESNPEITGFTRIMNKYYDCLNIINFEEKGDLFPVFENIQKEILKQYQPNIYNIIFLLIHNKPNDNDQKKLIDFFIDCNLLPISIITIFIGDKPEEEIREIKRVFKNNKKISSNKFVERIRSNVSFLSMKNCNFNNDILKNLCLREIPEQLLEFYRYGKTTPENIKQNDLDRIKESYKVFDPQLSMYEDAFCAPSIGESQINKFNENNIQNININNYNNNINNIRFKEDEKEIRINEDNNIYNKEEKDYINKSRKDERYYKDEKGYINTPGKDFYDNKEQGYINILKKDDNNNINKDNINLLMDNQFKNMQINNNINPEQNNKINIDIKINNPFRKKDYVNTPNPDKPNIILDNPYKSKKEVPKEQNKIEPNERYINNNINIDINKSHNKNEIIIDNEKKYINEIHNNFDNNNSNYINIINNNINNNIINNNFNKDNNDKKYVNATPNPDDINKKKIINNPYQKNNNIIENIKNEEKKYVNATPGNDIQIPQNINNPYQKNKIEKNEIKKNEEDVKEEKKPPKIGSHFKKKFNKDFSKLSTNSNSRNELDNYSRDN